MNAALVSLGTDGDIFPYVRLGSTLRTRGHDITLFASAQHARLARENGFAFCALVSEQEDQELFGHPDFWHPLKTARLAARWGSRFLRRHYELLASQVTPNTVLVANPGVLPALLVHEKLGVPLASVILQPWVVPSAIAPPVMPYLGFLQRAPRPVWQALWRGLDLVVDGLVGRECNALRASVGLPPLRRIFRNWLSKQLVIGLFPDWYGAPQPDWPPALRLTGFPMADREPNEPLPGEVDRFCAAGSAPIVFTFGTGMAHPGRHFQAALDACHRLGARGIFLTRFHDQLPRMLPPSILACTYAPFQKLFPRCAAVVHHGGIGTVAQAMAAGVPQLIQPICFDQADNGARVTRLGVGLRLHARHASGRQISNRLRDLLTDQRRAACREIASRFTTTDALVPAAQLIESLIAEGRPRC